MTNQNVSIHIEKAIIRVTPDALGSSLLKGQLIDLPATNQVRMEGGERFELVLGGEAITDHLTGLMWAAKESDRLDWDAGDRYCRDCRIGGFTDWLNPSDVQWQTIIDRKLYKPCVPAIFNASGDSVWTSTITKWTENETGSSRSFWFVSLSNGNVYYGSADSQLRVRPVRLAVPAGQSRPLAHAA